MIPFLDYCLLSHPRPVWFIRETVISVSIVSGYGLNDRAIEVRSPAEAKGFFL
jgi:hypothetical protein